MQFFLFQISEAIDINTEVFLYVEGNDAYKFYNSHGI